MMIPTQFTAHDNIDSNRIIKMLHDTSGCDSNFDTPKPYFSIRILIFNFRRTATTGVT
ncbi:hypothetical protein GWK75_01495 [Candidatus Saccharibacteria bacterium oral taxon 955]|nr:hypothetical protein GWK75_01495 [Candidatus Saccharibacteria bacterium oral taxon 955]